MRSQKARLPPVTAGIAQTSTFGFAAMAPAKILKPESRDAMCYLTQGCTTLVTGNCGGGRADIGKYYDDIDTEGAGINIAQLVPHGAVRDKIATWYTQLSGLKYTGFRMVSALSRGQTPGPEASISKVVVARANQDMASFALDLQDMGGILDTPALTAANNQFQRQFMRSPANRIEGGSDEILRNIIAERVLGLPPDIRVDKDVPWKDVPRS